MEGDIAPARRIEELRSFPFGSFQEFRDACRSGRCHVSLDRSTALQWAQEGKYTTAVSRFAVTALTFVPYLSVVMFVGLAVIEKSWFLLLALPLFVVAFVLFHPSMRFAGLLRSIPICLSLLGFLWGIVISSLGLIAITGVLLIIWLSLLAANKTAIQSLTRAVVEHEDILCATWRHGKLAIHLADGSVLGACPRNSHLTLDEEGQE